MARVERFLLEEFEYPVDLSVGLLQGLHRRAFGHTSTTGPGAGAYRCSTWARTCRPPRRACRSCSTNLSTSCATGKRYNRTRPRRKKWPRCWRTRTTGSWPSTSSSTATAGPRVFTNLLAYNYGYQDGVLYLYHPENGEGRTQYLRAIHRTATT